MSDDLVTRTNDEDWETLVQKRLVGRVHDLHLRIRERGIVLSGHATTYYAKQLAQHAAMDVTGLPVVANDIDVR